MWTRQEIVEKIKAWTRFWVPFLGISIVIIALIGAGLTHWRQTVIQKETLEIARLATQQQVILQEIKTTAIQATEVSELVRKQQEVSQAVVDRIERLSDTIIINQQEILKKLDILVTRSLKENH